MSKYRIHILNPPKSLSVEGELTIRDGLHVIKDGPDCIFGTQPNTVFIAPIDNVAYIQLLSSSTKDPE